MSAAYPAPHPSRRRVVTGLLGSAVVLVLLLCAVGWAITGLLTPSWLTRWEQGVESSVEAARTEQLNSLTHVGSMLSDTVTAIAVLVVVVLVLRVWLGRWFESWLVTTAIVGELLVFLAVTALVNRQRPGIEHLDAAPPTSSFPSGHTAAAVALYGAITYVVLRNLRPRVLAVVVAVVLCSIPFIVGASRIYRGMHHPTDVLFGLLGGGAWLAVTIVVLTTTWPRREPAVVDERPSGPGLHEAETARHIPAALSTTSPSSDRDDRVVIPEQHVVDRASP